MSILSYLLIDTTEVNMKTKKYCALAGKKIKELRLQNNLKVSELAKLSELSPSTIRRIETGNYDIELFTIYKLCRAFNIKALDFLNHWKLYNIKYLPVGTFHLSHPTWVKSILN